MQQKKNWLLNTSNKGKLHEFRQYFAEYGMVITATEIDLKEISADPLTVVVHKASQMGEEILVEDTSLDIQGAEVGINVRWLFDHLPMFVDRKACWRVLLAYLKRNLIYVYEAKVEGTIVLPQGNGGFGFDPLFLPDGSEQTLAQAKPFAVNARAKVVEALIKNQPSIITSPITHWNGSWQ
ncbi:MAG: non-canonical purine NTP pyrophosphatase [Parachlamydiaceae bacterium]